MLEFIFMVAFLGRKYFRKRKKFVSMQRVLNLWRSMLSAGGKETAVGLERGKRFSLSSIRIAN